MRHLGARVRGALRGVYRWRTWSPFQCHVTAIRCPHCGTDVTRVYRQAPWYRPETARLYTAYGFPPPPRTVGLQQCHRCYELWTVREAQEGC